MLKIIIGTKNQAKLKQIQGALAPLQMNVLGLPSDRKLPQVVEDGQTARENAKKKALTYAKTLNQPVLSMDNALYFKNLPKEQQPGINVRRIQARTDRPTDNELLSHYSKLVKNLGGNVKGHWEFALCYAMPDDTTRETTILSPRVFTNKISPKRIAGYPLESIQIDPTTNKYISEMNQQEQDQFWQRTIGQPLCEFVKNCTLD